MGLLEWDWDLPEELLKEWRSLVADFNCSSPDPDHTQIGVALTLPTLQAHHVTDGSSLS